MHLLADNLGDLVVLAGYGLEALRQRSERVAVLGEHGRLHIVLHHTAAAEAAPAAGAQRVLGSAHYRRAIGLGAARNRELLCTGLQCRAADPELHHGQHRSDRTAQEQRQDDARGGNELLHNARKRDHLYNAPQCRDDDEYGDGQVIVAKVVSPRGNLYNSIKGVHAFYIMQTIPAAHLGRDAPKPNQAKRGLVWVRRESNPCGLRQASLSRSP
jgi:hypothetical protein